MKRVWRERSIQVSLIGRSGDGRGVLCLVLCVVCVFVCFELCCDVSCRGRSELVAAGAS